MAPENTFSSCCLKSFAWDETPTGHDTTLSNIPTYITGTNPNAAVLYIHDALGWKFINARLLADHFAREANVTVYIPDFFGGEELDQVAILEGRFHDVDLRGFQTRNAREVREPEIFACAKTLRENGYKKIGAVGYCFGGWAVLRLAARPPLVDAVVVGHPSWLTESDLEGISVPVQFLAPETDRVFTDELKLHAFQKLVLGKPRGVDGKGLPVEWVHFPDVAHGCLTKGDEKVDGEREAMIRGKDAAVDWFRQWLT
ncbi:dienelactone hydrolase family protein [Cucurbitaria berberidis CBS 394.84]|uniref:Dienelactone hydrolase family protein n=1 Tax=Cucurbitaria berberidis CBS 394.84 TaxID=1168544 RepID=A0A9P4GLD0_9PLEO|nr:dienelactone hydrolase family protein [Cucurbitaria berberidis CBS 394.84]KAF1847725.1 dienelactone hydrolase family protein [Cucurbitaria berberidis CBS 394.84]